MARIRSVHPGLATDARFVVLSDAAQIFYVLLLTAADDAGVFRWEPLELRMQLRPASTTPIEPLLVELVAGNFLRRFEAGGNAYGAVRNFRRYQSPKLPTRRHPLPADLFRYVGLAPGELEVVPKAKAKKSEPDQDDESQLPQSFPSATEALTQPLPTERERERDRDRDREKERERESSSNESVAARPQREAKGKRPPPNFLRKEQEGEAGATQPLEEPPEGWIANAEAARDDAGLEPVNLMLEWLKFAARTNGEPQSRRWIEWALRAWVQHEPNHRGNGHTAAPEAIAEVPWAARMRQFHTSGWWLPDFGPKPGEPGCWVPPKFLA
jgi:hypothetical protein